MSASDEKNIQDMLIAAEASNLGLKLENSQHQATIQQQMQRIDALEQELKSCKSEVLELKQQQSLQLPSSATAAALQQAKKRDANASKVVELSTVLEQLEKVVQKLKMENEELKKKCVTNAAYMELSKENKTLRENAKRHQDEVLGLKDALAHAQEGAKASAKLVLLNAELTKKLKEEKQMAAEAVHAREKAQLNARKVQHEYEEAMQKLEDADQTVKIASIRSKKATELEFQDEIGELKKKTGQLVEQIDRKNCLLKEVKAQLNSLLRQLAEKDAHIQELRSHSHQTGGAEIQQLEHTISVLSAENADLRTELAAFDEAFFQELEDLKFNHSRGLALLTQYEHKFGKLN